VRVGEQGVFGKISTYLKELCFWEYISLVSFAEAPTETSRGRIPFEPESALNGKWQQVLCKKDNTALPVIFGYFNPDINEPDKDDAFQR
jgi:hypothetical protein